MFKDIKKFSAVRKLKSLREQVQQIPEYYDILENLHNNLHPGKICHCFSADLHCRRQIAARQNEIRSAQRLFPWRFDYRRPQGSSDGDHR